MKVAMIAPVGVGDAVAEYARGLANGLASLPATSVEIVALPEPDAKPRAKTITYTELAGLCNAPDVDVVHLHHAHRLFGNIEPGQYTFWELRYLLKKPIVITTHDTRSLEELLATNSGVWWKRIQKRRWLANPDFRDSVEIAPFVTALTITHTAWERQTLLQRGAKPGYLTIIPPGVPGPSSLPTPSFSNAVTQSIAIIESGITNEEGANIVSVWPSPDDPYAIERELAQAYPILAPDTPTSREIVARVPCLELYNPFATDDGDRRAKWNALLSDPARRERLIANARRYAQRFAWPRVAALTQAVYRDAIEIFNSGPHHGAS